MDGGFKTEAGRTLLGTMWEEHDACMDDLMLDAPGSQNEGILCKGRAQGIAWCIALLTHAPNDPNVGDIKVEAMERWESRNAVQP